MPSIAKKIALRGGGFATPPRAWVPPELTHAPAAYQRRAWYVHAQPGWARTEERMRDINGRLARAGLYLDATERDIRRAAVEACQRLDARGIAATPVRAVRRMLRQKLHVALLDAAAVLGDPEMGKTAVAALRAARQRACTRHGVSTDDPLQPPRGVSVRSTASWARACELREVREGMHRFYTSGLGWVLLAVSLSSRPAGTASRAARADGTPHGDWNGATLATEAKRLHHQLLRMLDHLRKTRIPVGGWWARECAGSVNVHLPLYTPPQYAALVQEAVRRYFPGAGESDAPLAARGTVDPTGLAFVRYAAKDEYQRDGQGQPVLDAQGRLQETASAAAIRACGLRRSGRFGGTPSLALWRRWGSLDPEILADPAVRAGYSAQELGVWGAAAGFRIDAGGALVGTRRDFALFCALLWQPEDGAYGPDPEDPAATQDDEQRVAVMALGPHATPLDEMVDQRGPYTPVVGPDGHEIGRLYAHLETLHVEAQDTLFDGDPIPEIFKKSRENPRGVCLSRVVPISTRVVPISTKRAPALPRPGGGKKVLKRPLKTRFSGPVLPRPGQKFVTVTKGSRFTGPAMPRPPFLSKAKS